MYHIESLKLKQKPSETIGKIAGLEIFTRSKPCCTIVTNVPKST